MLSVAKRLCDASPDSEYCREQAVSDSSDRSDLFELGRQGQAYAGDFGPP